MQRRNNNIMYHNESINENQIFNHIPVPKSMGRKFFRSCFVYIYQYFLKLKCASKFFKMRLEKKEPKLETIRVFQLLPSLAYGDGVGNDVLAINKILKNMGYETKIYAVNIDDKITEDFIDHVENIPNIFQTDIIIYHLSIGHYLNDKIKYFNCKKIIIYHSVTPPIFFKGYNFQFFLQCKKGQKDVVKLKKYTNYCVADSEYNKQELLSNGYSCKIDVVPILIPFEDYKQIPNDEIINKFNDEIINIVFVGRIAPNKKQEDIILSFYYYKKYFNNNARLFLVGSYSGLENYKLKLDNYIKILDLKDVYFTGHISFTDILSYYHIADVFLCMSEHEGFCIPLVEAMYFQIPIIAYINSGVKDTLNHSGLQMEQKDCRLAAEKIDLLMSNVDLRKEIIQNQNLRLADFGYDKTKKKLINCIENFLIEENIAEKK